jgi:hypothetical protein
MIGNDNFFLLLETGNKNVEVNLILYFDPYH